MVNMSMIKMNGESFEDKGKSWVSKEFQEDCETIIRQMKEQPAIDHVTFKHEELGEDITVYIRREDIGFKVSLEDKDFTVED